MVLIKDELPAPPNQRPKPREPAPDVSSQDGGAESQAGKETGPLIVLSRAAFLPAGGLGLERKASRSDEAQNLKCHMAYILTLLNAICVLAPKVSERVQESHGGLTELASRDKKRPHFTEWV